MAAVRISYFSDILCIWAYVTQVRLEQIVRDFADRIEIEAHYCSVFPDAWGKIESQWRAKDGFAGFNRHLLEVAKKFPHVVVHDGVWLDTRPRTSASAHLFLKAVEVLEREDGESRLYLERSSAQVAWALRRAFFEFNQDISDWQTHREIADRLGLDYDRVEAKIRNSEAMALLAADYQVSEKAHIEGSPTFVMNDGRQKLFGNVGYRVLEANIQELLRTPSTAEASWC